MTADPTPGPGKGMPTSGGPRDPTVQARPATRRHWSRCLAARRAGGRKLRKLACWLGSGAQKRGGLGRQRIAVKEGADGYLVEKKEIMEVSNVA